MPKKARITAMSIEKYGRLDRVNISTLKELRRSPAHYRHRLLVPGADSPAKRLGRAVHQAVLEPERFAAEYVVWRGDRRAGQEWNSFKSKNDGLEIITEKEYERCLALQHAVRGNSEAVKYLTNGKTEISALWDDRKTKIKCKGRLDFAGAAIVDLKTTRDASPEGFGREAWRYGYHLQAAFYQDGYFAATGLKLPVVLIAVETEPPNVVQIYQLPDHVLETGREEYSRLLDLLVVSRSTNRWPGYADSDLELTLPRWATNFDSDDSDSDEDVGALDLVI